ncbi:F-box/LRR-repeat protein 2 [Staphylotrichum tortipilum]|uniref:F-box/LRR-repeat protein 2 n=1 Tax=Staphylotrichum tortipilum TaxID=2831512 RepID=A0AAN6RSY3_9PEZI|nr:F-box/LRR-repeat protein 2 [Staphylotrichum longicolle]
MADAGMTTTQGTATPTSPATPDGVMPGDGPAGNGNVSEAQIKKRGRDRLLRGLQRMSSSPSLPRAGRSRSASSPYSFSGALSCVSLGSAPSPLGQPNTGSYFSQASAAEGSSAHTSIPTSPIPESPSHDGLETMLAIRPVDAAALTPTTITLPARIKKKTKTFNLWVGMPHEVKIHVLSFLRPKELVRASRVSKEFHTICFDGQLWTSLDASEFYREIPADSLTKIIESAGPFVKDLNLRGCLQVEHYQRAEAMAKACQNLINATLEGCRNFKRSTLHTLLKANDKLAHLNLTGLAAVNNATCKIIANSCPQLEVFNVSWCKQMDARGVRFVVDGCPKLKDLRAGEVRGFNKLDVAESIFRTNNLERLVLAGCDTLTDVALQTMVHGTDPEIDYLTDRPMVPPRKLRHLDLTRCSRLTSNGVRALGHLVPDLEGLQLSGVTHLTDAALEPIFASTPRLTHLELEELPELTNAVLSQRLAIAPCAPALEHLSISYCELLGDAGMLPVMRACTALRSVYMDNTRVSDLVLAEAAAMVRGRAANASPAPRLPAVGLTLVVYDTPNISWTGVREVLSRNAEPPSLNAKKDKGKAAVPVTASSTTTTATLSPTPSTTTPTPTTSTTPSTTPPPPIHPTMPREIISLKCYHGWQMTVDEHTKRVLRGDLGAARRLERKWADFMQANEEAGGRGVGEGRGVDGVQKGMDGAGVYVMGFKG